MTIVNQLQRIENNIKASYTALEEKGAELPIKQNSDNLASTIANLEVGGSGGNDETLKSIIEGTVTDIVLPDNVTSIRDFAFNKSSESYVGTDLTSIVGNGVEILGEKAFYNQTMLQKISFKNLKVISSNALYLNGSKLEELELGKLQSVGQYGCNNLLKNANLKCNITFDNCVLSAFAFGNCNLPFLDLTGVKSISGQRAFLNCTCAKIWIPSTIETILASGSTSQPFMGASKTMVIYTDVTSFDARPSGWGEYWNKVSSTELTVVYGANYEDFLNA